MSYMQNYNDHKIYDHKSCKTEYYYLNFQYHRTDGPAIITYYESGQISHEYYYLNGQRHRIDGPAYIEYDESGKIKNERHYINGNCCKKK